MNTTKQTSQTSTLLVTWLVFPALASTSFATKRGLLRCHAFEQLENERIPRELPYGIWTIPAVAYVGRSEEELTDARIPYEVGIAHFKEISRAHIMGEQEGILKLLFCPETLRLLGVHIIGPRAPELIHLGKLCVALRRDDQVLHQLGLQCADS